MSPAEFAAEVVRRLRAAGYEALWAGGCVRDRLLGIEPKDYDVATSATPDQIRAVFGQRRTLAIGASFGVITVLGPKGARQIEVATFRRDADYSDGRHPDSVSFTSAEEDAKRRDFTINGLFFDPVENRVHDFVGGQEDLRQRIIRAIGDPSERIAEDKLRMLRAVRFTARFGFALDPATLAAIQRQARELVIVSAERIAAEMRQILTYPGRAGGVALLHAAGLLEVILPEAAALQPEEPWTAESGLDTPWRRSLAILNRLEKPTFAAALTALIRENEPSDGTQRDLPRKLFERWKLTNDELDSLHKLLGEEPLIRSAASAPWPKLQRVLVAPRAEELLGYCEAVAAVLDGNTAQIEFCRQKLALPPDELNPPPLITGEDLKPLGIAPGPIYRELLEAVRDAQLERRIGTQAEALALAKQLAAASQ